MFCTKCGTEIPDDNKFCTACGASVEQMKEAVETTPETAPVETEAAEETPVAEETPAVAEETVETAPVADAVPNTYVQSPAAEAPLPVYQEPEVKGGSGLAIASMICGIVSLCCCCCIIPWFGLTIPAAALVLAIISLVKGRRGKGMAITGLITGGLALLIAIVVSVATPALENYMDQDMMEEIIEEILDEVI